MCVLRGGILMSSCIKLFISSNHRRGRLAYALICKLSFVLCIGLFAVAQAQQMDAQLNMAKRNIEEIQQGLVNIRNGDVSHYNKLSKQLTKTADLLKSTTSRAHPDFQKAVQNWSSLQTDMLTLSQQWQQIQANASQAPSVSAPAVSGQVVNANTILAKYQRSNRPALPNYPNPSDVEQWALLMKALQGKELQSDLEQLNSASVSAQDRQRVSSWIGGNFQQQITQDVQSAMQRFNSIAETGVQTSQRILAIDKNDKMRIYNFAHGDNGARNKQEIDAALVASANAMALEEVYPALSKPERHQQIGLLASAQQTLQTFTEVANAQAEVLANMPKKQKVKNRDFLKAIEQTLWLGGREIASLDAKGSIWMNSEDVGDIVSNGTIYVYGRDIGSIELDGKVWFNGDHVGTIEDNGKVWRSGSHVGTIEPNGKVWAGGQTGEIVPFDGEWKRAAVIYFFNDWFTRDAWLR